MCVSQRVCGAAAVMASLVAIAACNDRDFGRGLGRPDYVAPESVERIPVEITAVYVAGATDRRFVRLAALDAAVTLDGLAIRASGGETALSGTLTGEQIFCANALDTSVATAGEVAVVDGDGNVHALLAWGADPTTVASPSVVSAVLTGAAEAGEFAPLPFPAPDVAVVREGTTIGCASVQVTQCAQPATIQIGAIDAALCAPVAPTLRLTEILPASEGTDSWVELENAGATAVDLFGARICTPPTCASLPSAQVAAGGRALIWLGTEAPESASAGEIFVPRAAALAPAGEVAVIAPGSVDPAQSTLVQSFVRFGEGSGPLTAAAVAAGVWSDAAGAAPVPRLAGESLSLTPGAAADATGWYPTSPTPNAENLVITADNAEWTSCSYPKLPGPTSSVVISAVRLDIPQTIEVTNRGAAAIDDLRAYELGLGASAFGFASGQHAPDPGENVPVPLAAGETLVVQLDTAVADCPEEVICWPDSAATLVKNSEAFLSHSGAVVFYLKWGQGVTSAALTAAVTLGLWPLESCSLDPLGAGDSIVLDSEESGSSPADYRRE